MRAIDMLHVVLLVGLTGCVSEEGRIRSVSSSGVPVEQFACLPPFKALPVPIPNGDFSAAPTAEGQLPDWTYEGPPRAPKPLLGNETGRGAFFMADLAPGEKSILRTAESLSLTPHHYYRLELDVRGAPFTAWSVALVLRREGKALTSLPLWPLIPGAIPPSPVWEHRVFCFTAVPGYAKGELSFAYESKGANYGFRPGLGNIRLVDLGPVALPLAPARNLKLNPGLESEPFGDGTIPGWSEESGKVVEDPASAHSGVKLYRVNDTSRSLLSLAGGFVQSPCLVKASVWARGKGGRISLFMDPYAVGYVRLGGQSSPQMELAGEWRRCEWEFAVSPSAATWGITVDLSWPKTVDLDDMEVFVVPIKLPGELRRNGETEKR